MGLSLNVGELAAQLEDGEDRDEVKWLRRDLKRLNKFLVKNGLPEHHEPETLPAFRYRGSLVSFPYSYTHHLRRAVAYARHAPKKFAKIDRSQNPAHDPLIIDELSIYLNCHLICHSDCEGYYVPIDFPEPLFAEPEDKIPGSLLGSSQRLLAELIAAAPFLGIRLSKTGKLSDKEAAKLTDESTHKYGLERLVWFAYYETAKDSVEYNTVISFG
jgi:hypothetical protein